jgi:hypothetical protein
MKKILLYLFCLLNTALATAQIRETVTVRVIVPTPHTDRISYYGEPGRMVVTITNRTNQAQEVYLRGSIKGTDNDKHIYTDPNFRPDNSYAISIPAGIGQTITVPSQFIQDVYHVNNIIYSGTSANDLKRAGRLGEGCYMVCVSAWDIANHTRRLSAEDAGCSMICVRNIEAPILIKPYSDEIIKPLPIQNVIFSWNRPAGTPPNVRYKLKVIEIFDPARNPNDAFLSATTPAFFEEEVMGNAFVYGPTAPPLTIGRKYAWAVTAIDPNGETSFQNNGRSEVRSFIYGDTNLPASPLQARSKKETPNLTLQKIAFTPSLEITNLFSNSFKGKLVWAYKKTETGTFIDMQLQTGSIIIQPEKGNIGGSNHDFTHLEKTNGLVNSTFGQASKIELNNASPSDFKVYGGGISKVYQTTQTIPLALTVLSKEGQHNNKINELTDDKTTPLTNTKVSIYLKPSSALKNILPPKPTLLAGQGYSDDLGEFNINYKGKLPDGYVAYLKVENPYFEFAEVEIPLHKDENGVYDLGQLKGVAKTYRLKLNITNEDGMDLDAAHFKIVRHKDFYRGNKKNLEQEVHKQDSTFSEPTIVAQGLTKGNFSRLFFSNYTSDHYTLIIEGDNIIKSEYNISFKENLSTPIQYAYYDRAPVLEKTYIAKMPLPVVEGRVVTKNGEIPVQGATVRVRKKGSKSGESTQSQNGMFFTSISLNDRIGTTDSSGKFKIEGIPVASEPYELYVTYKGKGTVHQQDLYLSQRGVKEIIDPLYINAELITITGKVVDNNGEPLQDATLTWKSGGNAFYSDDNGNFNGSQTEGKHILVARKPGFKDTEYEVELKASSKSAGAYNAKIPENQSIQLWNKKVEEAYIASNPKVNSTTKPKPSGLQSSVYSLSTLKYYQNFTDGFASSEISSGHVIVLGKFFVKAIVKDHTTGNAIPNAKVSAEFSENFVLTNSSGIAMVQDVPGGNAAIVVKGPDNSSYTTIKSEIIVDASSDTATVELKLKAGSTASGIAKQNGTPLSEVEISVEGHDYISTKTDANGQYTLSGVPIGEYTLIASKEGLLGESKTGQFDVNKTVNLDFNLTDPGFNASKLLGFKMVLQKSRPGAAPNEFIISGELREIPDNPIFKIVNGSNFKLKFSEKTVIKSGNLIYPKGGELLTDVSEIPIKVHDYLVIKLKNSGGIKVRAIAGSNNAFGEIYGEGLIDIGATFSSITGINLPSVAINLTSNKNATIVPINSKGDINTSTLGIKSSTEGWKLYGVRLIPDLAASGITKDGINLKGKIKLEDVPLLSNQEFQLNTLTITKRGEIKNVAVNMAPPPTLSIVNWKLKLNGIQLNQYGIKFSGELDVPIPSSANAKIGVKDLGINNNLLTGGTFALPTAGVDIFNVVSFKTNPGKDFTFQKMAGTNHYRFIGAGKITFAHAQWLKEGIVLDNFSIATNGEFSVIAKTGIDINFADMAQLGITKFGFNSSNSTITVGGKFKLDIPMFGAGAEGTLHFQKGKAPRMDELGINFSLASAIALEAKLKFGNNEFRGKGGLKLAGMTGVELEFWYQKLQNGKKIGANFMTHAVIPIGIVKLTSLQGGFDVNTADNVYSIWAGGKITLAADPAGVIALDPVRVDITSTPQGPIFEGGAKVTLMTSWKIGEAKMVLNFGQKRFTIDGSFGGELAIMKGISAESRSDLFIELYTGNSWYWVVSSTMKTRIAKVFDSNVTLAAGWNVHKSASRTLSDIPDFVLTNGKLYGGYFKAYSSINVPRTTIGFKGFASISLWYENTGLCEVYANFVKPAFGFKIGALWAAGGNVEVLSWNIADADLKVKGALEGYYTSSNWGLAGHLSGHARLKFGCNADCNSIGWALVVPCGFRLCAAAGIDVSYINREFDFNLKFSE